MMTITLTMRLQSNFGSIETIWSHHGSFTITFLSIVNGLLSFDRQLDVNSGHPRPQILADNLLQYVPKTPYRSSYRG